MPLKTITYASIAVTLGSLLLTFLFLAGLRALRSNQHSIRKNLVASLFLSELIFLLGINQADLPVSSRGKGVGLGGETVRGRAENSAKWIKAVILSTSVPGRASVISALDMTAGN